MHNGGSTVAAAAGFVEVVAVDVAVDVSSFASVTSGVDSCSVFSGEGMAVSISIALLDSIVVQRK